MKTPTLLTCRRRLATLWFCGSGLLFVIFLPLTVKGHYVRPGQELPSSLQEAWGWFLPVFLPTLSLMVGVLIGSSRMGKAGAQSADVFVFKLALALSWAYLVVVLLTILGQPFVNRSEPMEFLKTSSLWLAPLQGLTTAALGAFFIKGGGT